MLIMTNYLLQVVTKSSRVLTLFKMKGVSGGWGPISFFRVTSTNVGIRPQNFLTFSFNTFATLM